MLRTFVQGKIHRIKITDLKPGYNGSCLISPDLMEAAGIAPFERVELYSLTAQARIATYVFPGAKRVNSRSIEARLFTLRSATR